LVFGASSPSSAPATGGTLDFVGTLTNTGNADVPFTLGTPALTGSPAGWSAPVLTGSTCPNPLVMGDSCTFTLRVTVPSGANGGAQAVTISATADNSGISGSTNVTVSASVSASVDILRSVSLGAAAETSPQTGMPTQVLTFTHTLTNLGNVPDSFTISLSPTSPASVGMAVLSPTSFTSVARNATRTITLVVTVPSGVLAGTNLPFVVTATSQGSAGVTASQTDTATVGALDAAQISPGTSKNGLPGTTLTFTHTLTNTGSTLIDYTITATNSQAGFSPPVITSGSQILSVSPGVTKTVTIQVILPTDPSSGTGTTTTVQVTKSGSATVLASATDTARVGKTYDVVITPNRTGVGYPKTTLVFTHTVTNIGINTDTYTVAATNSLAWSEGVSPDLFTLGPGASQIISVMIDIPNDNSTIANARNFGRVRVVSRTKPDDSHSEAVENITVGQTAEVDLSGDEARAVTPHSGTIRMSDLVLRNNGNGDDTFDLIVSGADSGWSVDIISFDLLGPHEIDYNIMARVGVPANVAPGITKTITIVARSRHSQAVVGEVRLRFIYIAQAVRIVYQSYLPIVAR
ncbi:MAG: NEW3 domain-containing protein, partial [Chloroflexales bacterium]